MTRPRREISNIDWAPLAASQHGLVSREQVLAIGLTASRIFGELARGRWAEVRPGVYRSTAAPETWQQRALAACIGRVRAAALSHRSAAYLHGLVAEPPNPIEVVAPRGTAVDGLSRVARVHHVRRGPGPTEIVTLAGLPVTSLPRTIADLAGVSAEPGELGELVDRAMRSRRSDSARSSLLRSLERVAHDRRGSVALRRALAPWSAGGTGARQMQSVLEAQVLRVLLDARLPAPRCQFLVVLLDEYRIYLDFAWPAFRVALEVDGYAFHSHRDAFEHDRSRGNLLLASGWQVLHTTAAEIRHRPHVLIGALGAVLGERGSVSWSPGASKHCHAAGSGPHVG